MEKWKLLLAGIRNALTDLVKKTFNVTGSVEVSNLPEVQHVVIDNHQEPSETVQVSNLVDYKEDLNKIIGELIKVPKDIKTADYSPIIKALQDVVKTLEAGKTDYSPIILAVESAVKALKLEYPEADYSSIINVIKGIQQFNLEPYLEEGELPVIINEKQIKKLVDAFGKKTGQVVAASMGGGGLSVADSTVLAGVATETTLDAIKTNTTTATSIGSGKTTVTTAGTQVALSTTTTIKSVTVKALVSNTGLIYVGTSTVASTDGFELSPGDSVSMDVDNLTDVYVDSAVNGEGVSYLYTV